MPFDLEAARKAQKSDDEIADYLAGQYGFDAQAARKAGKSSTDIAEYLAKNERPQAAPQAAEAPKTDFTKQSIGTAAVQNFPRDFASLMKELYGAVRHPLQTAEGMGGLAAGGIETGLQKMGVNQGKPQTQEQSAFSEFIRPLVESLQNPAGVPGRAAQYVADRPAHALTNLSMLTRGAGKLTGVQGLERAGTAIDPVNMAAKTVAGVAKPLGYLGRQAAGFTTGQKYPIINDMYQTLKAGGDPAETAVKYLRGKLESEDTVNVYKGALKTIRDDQIKDYTTRLKALENDPTSAIAMTELHNELTKKLYDYGVRVDKEGSLDFSRSKAFAADLQGQKDVQQITEVIRGWGKRKGDNTPFMLDTLRGILQDFYSPSGKSREFATALKNIVKDKVSDRVPEYREMLKNYEQKQELFEQSKKIVGMSNPNDRRANSDLLIKRLQRTMREDPEFARDFIGKIEKESGKDIKSVIAAYSMSQALPGGIVGRGMLGGTLYETARGGLGAFDPHLAVMMGMASPRVVGEFLNVMAKTTRGAGQVREALTATTTPRQIIQGIGTATAEPGTPDKSKADAVNRMLDRFEKASSSDKNEMRPDLARAMRRLKKQGVVAEERTKILKRWNAVSGD